SDGAQGPRVLLGVPEEDPVARPADARCRLAHARPHAERVMAVSGTAREESAGPLVDAIECLGEWAGRAISWLTLACVLVCFAVVTLRYVFGIGFVFLQELYVWLHAIVFTGGAAYALKHDTH